MNYTSPCTQRRAAKILSLLLILALTFSAYPTAVFAVSPASTSEGIAVFPTDALIKTVSSGTYDTGSGSAPEVNTGDEVSYKIETDVKSIFQAFEKDLKQTISTLSSPYNDFSFLLNAAKLNALSIGFSFELSLPAGISLPEGSILTDMISFTDASGFYAMNAQNITYSSERHSITIPVTESTVSLSYKTKTVKTFYNALQAIAEDGNGTCSVFIEGLQVSSSTAGVQTATAVLSGAFHAGIGISSHNLTSSFLYTALQDDPPHKGDPYVKEEEIAVSYNVVPVPTTHTASLTVTEKDSGKPLSGAIFRLYTQEKSGDSAFTGTYTTAEDGTISLTLPGAGNFYWQEVSPPAGYYPLDEPQILFRVTPEAPTVERSAQYEKQPPPVRYTATLCVTEAGSGDPLSGAGFRLYTQDGFTVPGLADIYSTPQTGTITLTLPGPGTFQWKEVSAPNGYVLSRSMPSAFTVSELEPAGFTSAQYSKIPAAALYNISLLKTDAADKNIVLAGAEFSLYGGDGSFIQAGLKTDQSGVFTVSGMKAGSYYFIETQSPEGYRPDAKTKHFVTLSDTDVKITVTNEKNTKIPEEEKPVADRHIAFMQGYTDGTVRPGAKITRAESATMLYRLLSAEKRDSIFTSENSFSDVSQSLWYNKAVSSMTKGLYINGYPSGSFGGAKPITRAEFIKLVVELQGVRGGNSGFNDTGENQWYFPYVAAAKSLGWIDGYSDGSFRPGRHITRAEAATIINRAMNRGVTAEGIAAMEQSPDFKNFPDNIKNQWYYYEILEAVNGHSYTGGRNTEIWTDLGVDVFYDKAYYEAP